MTQDVQDPGNVNLPLAYVGRDDQGIVFANHFLIQMQGAGEHILTVGQVAIPPVIGDADAMREQMARLPFVPVTVLARYAMTGSKIRELAAALAEHVNRVSALEQDK